MNPVIVKRPAVDAALIFIVVVLILPLILNMTSFTETNGLGDAAGAGLVLTMFTVGGMIGGAIFSKAYALFKKNTISLGRGLLAVGMAYGNTILFMYMATTLTGIGTGVIIPTIFITLGMKSTSYTYVYS